MNRWLALLLLVLALPASAGDYGYGYGGSNDARSSVMLRVRADVLAVPLVLRADKRDMAERVQSLSTGRATLLAAARQKGWELVNGVVQAPAAGTGKLSSLTGTSAEWRFTLHVPLQETTDPFGAMAAVIRWADTFKPADGVEMSIGPIVPSLRDPQKYRPQLLKLIAEEVARTREAIPGTLPAQIGGLENAVVLRAVDEREVQLSLAYTLSLEKR
ncbi:hypothetical protein BWI17_20780 [Betaproteobacteria bacterium GR16-43]|nr:hypothetical protein BWI17_20780 [Betaproteobacteria bacterium GR16-43]